MKSISDWFLTHSMMWKKFDGKRNLKITHKTNEVKEATQAIIFFPYWTGKSTLYNKLAKKFPESTTVFFDYPNEIVSSNITTSLGYIKRILYEAAIVIRNLRRKGITEIVLVGSSLGSNIALKLSTIIPVEKVVLNMIDRNYARATFESPATIILQKKLLRNGITQKKLNKIYSIISTDQLIPKIKNKKDIQFLIYTSDTDIFCTYKEFEPELKTFDKYKIAYEVKRSRILGHILSIYWNAWFSRKLREFIRK